MPFFKNIKLPKLTTKQIVITLLIVIPVSYFSIPIIRKVYESFQIVFDPEFAGISTNILYLTNEGRGMPFKLSPLCLRNLDEYLSTSTIPKELSDKVNLSLSKYKLILVDANEYKPEQVPYSGDALIYVQDKSIWDNLSLKEKKSITQQTNNTIKEYFNIPNYTTSSVNQQGVINEYYNSPGYTTSFATCIPNSRGYGDKKWLGYIQNIKGKENISIGEW
jgi:hypothetical protein